MTIEHEEINFYIGQYVTILKSPSDADKSIGKEGLITGIYPTARGDGSVWINYSVSIRPGYGVSCREEHLSERAGAGNNTLVLPTTSPDILVSLGTTKSWIASETFNDTSKR